MTRVSLPELPPQAGDGTSLMGLARLMSMAFDGVDLLPVATELIERTSAHGDDANAMMDLSTILQLRGIADLGLATQAQALEIKRLYELPASREPAIRLLALMAPGELMANTPLPFLIEDSDVSLSMLYLFPGETIPRDLPDHDVVFTAISESDATRALLAQLDGATASWTKAVCNQPGRITRTSRAEAYKVLEGVQGLCMPACARSTREELQAVSANQCALRTVLPDAIFPLIIRPVDSHAGHGLAKVDDAEAISAYLESTAAVEFFISRFIDYSAADGLFRKYRIVLIDRVPFAGHMGISAHWMIHYLNAGMAESAEKRAEEERFMNTFDEDFGSRHALALRAIADRFGLDYLVIDCAETADGKLLVFEVDPGAVVHSMDCLDLFPYKRPQMKKVFRAFRAMLDPGASIKRGARSSSGTSAITAAASHPDSDRSSALGLAGRTRTERY